jgi:hypothetical protein
LGLAFWSPPLEENSEIAQLDLNQFVRKTVILVGPSFVSTISLEGPVDSQQEEDTTATVGEIAGKDKVDNQVEVNAANK